MCRLLVLISVSVLFAVVFSCAPTRTAPAPATNSTGRRKRSAEDEVNVIVETNKEFDESAKDLHLAMVNSIIKDYQTKTGIVLELGQLTPKNHGGKLAVEFKVHHGCDEIKEFAKGMKAEASVIDYIYTKYNEDPVEVL